MKNFKKLILISAAGATLLASCDDGCEPLEEKEEPMVTVAMKCEVPAAIRVRSADSNGMFGDGTEANTLRYAIYKYGKLDQTSEDEGKFEPRRAEDGKFYLGFELEETALENNGYEIFLWADAWGDSRQSPFTFDYEARTATIDYAKSLGMYDKADAFAYFGSLSVDENSDFNVTLYRPTAQINVVTPEFNTFNEDNDETTMKVGFAMHLEGEYVLPNVWNYGSDDYHTESYGSIGDISQIIARSPKAQQATIRIKGVEMRYVYMTYVFPLSVKEDIAVPSTVTTEWTTNNGSRIAHVTPEFFLTKHWRYFLYPKGSEGDIPGEGFQTASQEMSVEIYPGFYSSDHIGM